MYKLYITFLFIISLSAFHQIESVNVTLKSSVNDVNDNPFKDGDDINLSCKCDLEPKEVLVSVKINFGTVWIYDSTQNHTTNHLNGASEVMDHGLKNNQALIMIRNATQVVEGDYSCEIQYKIDANASDTKNQKSDIKISNWKGGVVNDFKFSIHLRSDEKKIKEFHKGDNVVIKCTPDLTNPEVESIELQHNKVTFYEFKNKTAKYQKNDNITEKDTKHTEKSAIEIEILKIDEKMRGEYSCKIQIKDGDKHYTEPSKSLNIGDVKSGTSMLNFSFTLIVVSLISTIFLIRNKFH